MTSEKLPPLRMTYKNPDALPWTWRDEIPQRIGNVWRMLTFAWLAARYDSMTFAVVFMNCARDVGDGHIAVVMKNGRVIDPMEIK